MAELRLESAPAARALEFTILTATRTGAVFTATWSEIDFAAKVWVIPATHMKAGIEHRVPLSGAALAVLEQAQALRVNEYVFPGGQRGHLSHLMMMRQLRGMGHGNITVHGFRSTFRDWAAELTNFPREVAEMALAHSISSAVEAAYRRGDLFDKRRHLMDAWAQYCAKPASDGKVLALRSVS
jgi:integrase